MIQTAKTYLKANPGTALGRVEVECQCGDWRAIESHVSCQVAGALDGSTILVCTEAGEVGEMCGNRLWCELCGLTNPERLEIGGREQCPCCLEFALPVTHRIFACDLSGEKVDWDEVLYRNFSDGDIEGPRPLTVVLVGEAVGMDDVQRAAVESPLSALRASEQFRWQAEAAAACAEAGVQWVTAGGRMELP